MTLLWVYSTFVRRLVGYALNEKMPEPFGPSFWEYPLIKSVRGVVWRYPPGLGLSIQPEFNPGSTHVHGWL
jgi:hypothetical protein